MPALAQPTDRFGAWGGGPLTGTVTRPPPSAGPTAPPSATSGGGYLPQPGAALPSSAGGGGGDGTGAMADPSFGGDDDGSWGGGPGDFGNGSHAGLGGGGDGPGGPTSMGGIMSFEDGGDVDADGDNDGDMAPTGDQNQATQQSPMNQPNNVLDPMSIIKSALDFGRQQMGMPKNFTQGSVSGQAGRLVQPTGADNAPGSYLRPQSGQGFQGGAGNDLGNTDMASNDPTGQTELAMEDGGEIPDPSQDQGQEPQQGTGGGLPDPRKTIQYLAGAGGVQPDIATALERHIDPQGMMDPAERTLKAISTAPTPESQFGMMQHYRTRANAYAGAAHAAMDQGNLTQAAEHATSAFNNTPTGYKVKFAPAAGGLAVMASKIGGQPQPQQQQSYFAGGEVPNGGGGGDGPLQLPFDPDVEQNLGLHGLKNDPAARKDAYKRHTPSYSDGGAVDSDNPTVMMKSYDAGGEVDAEDDGDDDDLTTGVIPTDAQGQQQAPDPGTEPAEQAMNPVVLNPDQVKKVVAPGAVDAANDHPGGFMGWLHGLISGATDATSPGAPAAPGQPATQGGQALQKSGGLGGMLRSGVQSVMSSIGSQSPDVGAALQEDQPAKPQGQQGQQGDKQFGPPAPPGPSQSFPRNQAPGRSMPAGAGQGQTPAADPMDAKLQQLTKQADAIFGHDSRDMPGVTVNSAGIQAQKQAYIQKGMEEAQKSEATLANTREAWGGRSGIASDRNTAANGRVATTEEGKNNRQAASLAEKLQQAQIMVNGRAANNGQTQLVRLITSNIAANPTGISNPEQILKQIAPFAAQMKQQGVTPQDIMQTLRTAQQGGQTGQTGQQPQPGERKQFKQGWGVWDGTAWKPE